MIKNMLKWRKESDTYLTRVCKHCWSRQITMKIDKFPELSSRQITMKIDKFPELSSSSAGWKLQKFIYFHCDLSSPVMSTDMSWVGVTLFPQLNFWNIACIPCLLRTSIIKKKPYNLSSFLNNICSC